MNTISEWLASLGLGEYAERFADNAVDLSILRDLTDNDLKELGVLLGHRRKMLRAIAELYGAQPSLQAIVRETAERRHLTVMFCDLVGSTALSARLDPEDMRKVIGAYYACIADVIDRHQGYIARHMGDGVLAYFGYPHAHEDDAEQAVRAGLMLIEAVSQLHGDIDTRLQIRIGIATGTVVVGDIIGEGPTQERTVVGETPNLAARLQTLAEPGTVVICANTRRLTGGHFEYREFGPVVLKGWEQPLPVWQVVGASGVESRFAAQKTRLTPLIGRDEEIELLLRRWRHAVQGEGRVVALTGEPGIGKSHIALALEERIQDEPHTSVRLFCSLHHTNSALFPFITQLERVAQFERGDSPSDRLQKLEAFLAHTGADAERMALVANLLGLPADDRHLPPDLSPQKRKERTLAALLAQLEDLAARQPVLAIFEDAHWIDPTSLELLALTVERIPKLRVLLLITARPEFTPPWPGHAHVSTVPLTRLARRDGAALIERVTEGKALPEEVTSEILARTDGVPLFIEELTKTLLESGLLRERSNDYVLDRPLPALAIPSTLQASLAARLDRLAPVREVAQIGAVVGREFSYELLSAVAGLPEEKLDEALGELVRSGLVFRRGEIPEAVYTFKHVLVRDAAYAGLLKSRRAHLHAVIATAFERQFVDVVEAQPEILAHHLTEAGLSGRAVGYWLKAGQRAALRSANQEAVAHLQRGLDSLGLLPDGPANDRLELDFLFGMAPCLIAMQGPASSRAMATFARARELCERLGDPPEYLQVMFWLTTASVMRGELPQAREAITALLDRAEARGDRPALLNAMRGQAMILLFMGRVEDAHRECERAVEAFAASDAADQQAARAAGQDAGVAGLSLMSWALWLLGHVDTAVARMSAALDRAEAIDHPHTRAYACYYAAVLHALCGEPAKSCRYAECCLVLSEEHGFRQWRSLSRAVRGICKAMIDPASGTLSDVKSALEEYRSSGYQLGVTALDVLLCPALLLQGQVEAALEVIEQGLAVAQNNAERIFEAELFRLQGRGILAQGGPDAQVRAEALFQQALAVAREQQARSLELRAANDLAALWIDQEKREEALAVLAPIHDGFTEGFDTQDLKTAKALLVQLRRSAPTAAAVSPPP